VRRYQKGKTNLDFTEAIGAVDGVIDGCLSELDINEEMVIEKLQKMRQDKAGGDRRIGS